MYILSVVSIVHWRFRWLKKLFMMYTSGVRLEFGRVLLIGERVSPSVQRPQLDVLDREERGVRCQLRKARPVLQEVGSKPDARVDVLVQEVQVPWTGDRGEQGVRVEPGRPGRASEGRPESGHLGNSLFTYF